MCQVARQSVVPGAANQNSSLKDVREAALMITSVMTVICLLVLRGKTFIAQEGWEEKVTLLSSHT